jgi:hypothetical protein
MRDHRHAERSEASSPPEDLWFYLLACHLHVPYGSGFNLTVGTLLATALLDRGSGFKLTM